jgi:hypothetical protein
MRVLQQRVLRVLNTPLVLDIWQRVWRCAVLCT